MFSTFEWMVSLRYLRSRRQEGFISVIAIFSFLGIMLGVATLIIVMAVMNGFRQELLGRILGLSGHFFVAEKAVPSTFLDQELVEKLEGVSSVTEAMPLVYGQALITANNQASGAVIRGIQEEDFLRRSLLVENVLAGNVQDFKEDHIAIGSRMALRLGLSVGDRLTLIAPQGKTTLFGTVPRMRVYPIALIFNVGMYEYDNNFLFMPLDAAQTFFRMKDTVSTIEIFVSDPNDIRTSRRQVSQVLDTNKYRLTDWQQTNNSFFNALQVERNVMFLILTLIIIVAAFNIISSLIMLVKDKNKDIAILRTMGATRGMMIRIFFLTGGLIGVIGTIAGFVLGVTFCENIESIRQALQSLIGVELFAAEIYFLSTLPAEIQWNEVLRVVIMALGLSFLATIYPSWKASRLDPVEVLRYE